MSLLDKAKQSGAVKRATISYDAEQLELALAWMRGEIGMTQVSRALEINENNRGGVYNFLAIALREAFRKGLLHG